MAQKRQLDKYLDPDYQQFSEIKKTKTNNLTETEKKNKICEIIKKEFLNELTNKEQEINLIENRLLNAKRLLHRVRYAVVASFYCNKSTLLNEEEVNKSQDPTGLNFSKENPPQQAVHPSLKKLIGKKPINYDEILKIRPERQAAKTAKTSISHKLRSKKDEKRRKGILDLIPNNSTEIHEEEKKIPRYIEPIKVEKIIPQLNSSRGRDLSKHLIVVGNTSKYIWDPTSSDNVTHKWLVYVRTKTDIPIEKMLSKVRFFLHPSYQPNDVVDVCSPPFQLSRRGWGEFPVRLQLYFDGRAQQKPLQIIHTLVLDRKHTGLQTLGAETVVEMWLNLYWIDNKDEENKPIINGSDLFPSFVGEKIVNKTNGNDVEVPIEIKEEKSLVNGIQKTNGHTTTAEQENKIITKQPTQIKQEVEEDIYDCFDENDLIEEDYSYIEDEFEEDIKIPETKPVPLPAPPQVKIPFNGSNQVVTDAGSGKKYLKYLDTNGTVILLELAPDPNNPKNMRLMCPPTLINGVTKQITNNNPPLLTSINSAKPQMFTTNLKTVNNNQKINKSVFKPPIVQNKLNSVINKNQVVLKNGQIFIIDPKQQKIQKTKSKQISLLKPKSSGVSLLKPIVKAEVKYCPIDHDYTSKISKDQRLITPSTFEIKKEFKFEKPVRTILGTKTVYPVANFYDIQINKINYKEILEKVFYKSEFCDIRTAVVFVLTKCPYVSSLASQINYRRSFPFIVESEEIYEKLSVPKKRANEWVRAKFVHNLLKNHNTLKTKKIWTTKEIILFARKFAYSPKIQFLTYKEEEDYNENSIKEMIKKEIKREKLTMISSTSYNHDIYEWLNEFSKKIISVKDEVEVINVDDDDVEEDLVNNKFVSPQKCIDGSKTVMALKYDLETEGAWVSQLCSDISINLKTEEIIKDVLHPSTQRVLVEAVKSFLSDLLRRSYGASHSSSTIPNQIRSEDIRNAILSTKQFDFLTNKFLGVAKPKEQSNL